MAARAHATTVEVASSHSAQLSHPYAVRKLIVAAASPPITGLRLSGALNAHVVIRSRHLAGSCAANDRF